MMFIERQYPDPETEFFERQRRAVTVPVPFLNSSTGAGDLMARLTQAIGIQSCPPCEQRKQLLNQIQFRPWGEW